MKIAIMSDSHDAWSNLSKAIEIANGEDCEYLLFAGDFMSPPGVPTFTKFQGKIVFVWGNNDGEKMGFTRLFDATNQIELAGDIYEGNLGGVKIFMNHYPKISELAAKSGEFDLCIHGHTHIYRNEMVGETLLVNPGEIQGYKTAKASFMIYDTESKEATSIDLN